ncbi:MAG: hypothetical protein J2P46_03840 [Zavarzinella sp.]|nr:hypothetical protein [Zavarzinella sp.]
MSSFESRFTTWLRRKRSALDEACANAIREGLKGLGAMELNAANASVTNLYASDFGGGYGPGSDCDYSLKGVGPLYAGHWHGKRIHDSLSFLVPLRGVLSGQPLQIVDVGAGTGALLWAWVLIASFSREVGSPLPNHTWTSLDSSSEMLGQGERLWTSLCKVLPAARQVVTSRPPVCGDWRTPPALPRADMVIGSFLLSRRDLGDPARTAKDLEAFLNRVSASAFLTWTKDNKSAVLDHLKKLFSGWKDAQISDLFKSPLSGPLRACRSAVQEALARSGAICEPESLEKQIIWGGATTKAYLLWMMRSSA